MVTNFMCAKEKEMANHKCMKGLMLVTWMSEIYSWGDISLKSGKIHDKKKKVQHIGCWVKNIS
jgi:hypothetical protein